VQALDGILMRHLANCGAKLPRKNPDYAQPPPPAKRDQTLPRVLILGDSISMGYQKPLQNQLQGMAEVSRAKNKRGRAENCAGTMRGVERIDAWLAQDGGKWDVIHFNFGLHDLKRVQPGNGKNSNDPKDPYQSAPEVYRKQLLEITGKLEKTGAKLIFATTTPVPMGVRPYRDVKDPGIYNAIALEIMKSRGIAVNDLFGFAEARLAKIQNPGDVHFSRAGSRALGQEVARHIKRALLRPKK
jgi:lysophospholipase L1-like esterase